MPPNQSALIPYKTCICSRYAHLYINAAYLHSSSLIKICTEARSLWCFLAPLTTRQLFQIHTCTRFTAPFLCKKKKTLFAPVWFTYFSFSSLSTLKTQAHIWSSSINTHLFCLWKRLVYPATLRKIVLMFHQGVEVRLRQVYGHLVVQ